MKKVLVTKESKDTSGSIHLEGSKSISNRVLLISALCDEPFNIKNLSISDDSDIFQEIIRTTSDTRTSGHAGTAYRFATAYLCTQGGYQVLTGSERMKERPIGPLVDALRSLGADIEYLEKSGFPPLRIGEIHLEKYSPEVAISGGISSQYLSALLMIAPKLPQGIVLEITDSLVSKPYLEMTLKVMAHFGIQYEWLNDNTIKVDHQKYIARDITVESDWSAASYYYEIAGFADQAEIELHGLFQESFQGDAALQQMCLPFGVESIWESDALILRKNKQLEKEYFDYNFILQPDLAQSIAVLAAGLGTYSVFSGLQTLKIKETDRIAALKNELEKCGVSLSLLPKQFSPKSDDEHYAINGKAQGGDVPPQIATYKDHRMAMSFAPLGQYFPIEILAPNVVTKSYKNYWKDIESLGFGLKFSEV